MTSSERRRSLLQRLKNDAGKLGLEELKKTEKKKTVIGCERRRQQAVEELEKESEEAAPKIEKKQLEEMEIPIMIGNTGVCSFCGRLDHNFKNCVRRLEAVERLEKERILRDNALRPREIDAVIARLNDQLRDVRFTMK